MNRKTLGIQRPLQAPLHDAPDVRPIIALSRALPRHAVPSVCDAPARVVIKRLIFSRSPFLRQLVMV